MYVFTELVQIVVVTFWATDLKQASKKTTRLCSYIFGKYVI